MALWMKIKDNLSTKDLKLKTFKEHSEDADLYNYDSNMHFSQMERIRFKNNFSFNWF